MLEIGLEIYLMPTYVHGISLGNLLRNSMVIKPMKASCLMSLTTSRKIQMRVLLSLMLDFRRPCINCCKLSDWMIGCVLSHT